MAKRRDFIFLVAAALFVLVLGYLWRLVQGPGSGDAPPVRWRPGRLTVSERAYYVNRFERVTDTWRQMGREEPNEVHLVIDVARRSAWVEHKGRRVQNCATDLPDWMAWEVHRTAADGTERLGGFVRLAYRTGQSRRLLPERIWVVGQSQSGEILAMHFDRASSGSRHGIRPFHKGVNVPALQDGVDYGQSMVVSDAEYRASQPSQIREGFYEIPADSLRDSRNAWSKAERKMYQVIEGQIIRADLELHQLSVVPGPDYSAAHAELTVFSRGVLRNMVRRRTTTTMHLKIDHLGNGVWYVRSADDPRRPWTMRRGTPQLEFLVSAGESVKPTDWPAWLEKGHRIPEGPIVPYTKWRAELANGVVVEFLGTCENPSEGKEWWGPDGSPIGYVPCLADRPRSDSAGDRKILEFAWRMQLPANARSLYPRFFFEDGFPSQHRRPRDRYGVLLLDMHHHSHIFEESQEKTTLTLGADVDSQGIQSVKFKNISLVPGRDFGFEIEVVE